MAAVQSSTIASLSNDCRNPFGKIAKAKAKSRAKFVDHIATPFFYRPMPPRPQQRMSKSSNNDALDPKSILEAASCQWLSVAQLMYLLDPKTCPMIIANTNPKRPPPSGTLILYNRAVTRRYKDDGYRWVKKRNSTKVREDHVKLRLDGFPRVSGTYVHSIDIPTLHRRAYHVIPERNDKKKDDEDADKFKDQKNSPKEKSTGADESKNTSSSGGDGDASKEAISEQKPKAPVQSLILVHYLDTRMATRVAASQAHINIMDISNIPHPPHFGDMQGMPGGVNPMMKFGSPGLPFMMTDGMNGIQNKSLINSAYQGNEQQLPLSSYQGRGPTQNIASLSSNFKTSEQKDGNGVNTPGDQLSSYLHSGDSSQNDNYFKYCEKNLESFKNGFNNLSDSGGLSSSNNINTALSCGSNSYLQNYGTGHNEKKSSSENTTASPVDGSLLNNGNNDDYLKYCQKNLESFNKMYKAMQEKAGKNFNAIQQLRGIASGDSNILDYNGNGNINTNNNSGGVMNQACLNNYLQNNNNGNTAAHHFSAQGSAAPEGQYDNICQPNTSSVGNMAQNLTPFQQQRLASVADSLSPQTLNMLINMIKDGKDDDVNAFLERNQYPPHLVDGNNNIWNSKSLPNNGHSNLMPGVSTSQQQNYMGGVYRQRQQQITPNLLGGNHQSLPFGEPDSKKQKQQHYDNSDGAQGFFPGYQAQFLDPNKTNNNRMRAEFQQDAVNHNPNAWSSLLQQHQPHLFPGGPNASSGHQNHPQENSRDFLHKARNGSYMREPGR